MEKISECVDNNLFLQLICALIVVNHTTMHFHDLLAWFSSRATVAKNILTNAFESKSPANFAEKLWMMHTHYYKKKVNDEC